MRPSISPSLIAEVSRLLLTDPSGDLAVRRLRRAKLPASRENEAFRLAEYKSYIEPYEYLYWRRRV